jgi:hypothetical protein
LKPSRETKNSKNTMSDHLHKRLQLDDGDVVEIDCDTQCNVLLMDDSDYSNYKARRSYRYHGGFFTHFPAHVRPSHSGAWNVVLDLGGGRATVRHSITVIHG